MTTEYDVEGIVRMKVKLKSQPGNVLETYRG
jgi:hypothetical protein